MWQCDTSSYGGDWESGKRPKIQSGWGRFLNSFCHHGSKTRYVKSCTIIKKSSGLFSLRAEKSSSVWSGSTCSFFFCIYVFSSLGSNCIWGGCGALVPCSLWHCAFWFDILIFHLQEGLGIQPMSAGRRAGGWLPAGCMCSCEPCLPFSSSQRLSSAWSLSWILLCFILLRLHSHFLKLELFSPFSRWGPHGSEVKRFAPKIYS